MTVNPIQQIIDQTLAERPPDPSAEIAHRIQLYLLQKKWVFSFGRAAAVPEEIKREIDLLKDDPSPLLRRVYLNIATLMKFHSPFMGKPDQAYWEILKENLQADPTFLNLLSRWQMLAARYREQSDCPEDLKQEMTFEHLVMSRKLCKKPIADFLISLRLLPVRLRVLVFSAL